MTNQPDDRCEHLVTEQAGSSYLRCKDCGVLKELTLNSSISAGLSVKTASEEIATVDPDDLLERLSDEADLCRNDDANDIADLLDEAAAYIKELTAEVESSKALANTYKDQLDTFLSQKLAAEARAAKAEEALRVIATNKTRLGITWAQEYAREALGEEKA